MERKEIFGISFSLGGYNELLELSLLNRNSYVCFCNSHMVSEHHKNLDFKGVLESADMVFPDGMPLVYTLRLLHSVKQERIAGNDAINFLIDKAKRSGLRLSFIGGSEEVLGRIKFKVEQQGIRAQFYSPPFKKINEFNFEEQANFINSFNPDIVLVGLGCPKQEIWMYKMRDKIGCPMYGLGGAFLLYAGIDKRAPRWMRVLSLEWLYRLVLEPKRLFKRYLITNSYFCFLFAKELIKKIFYR